MILISHFTKHTQANIILKRTRHPRKELQEKRDNLWRGEHFQTWHLIGNRISQQVTEGHKKPYQNNGEKSSEKQKGLNRYLKKELTND